ncbi:EndoU domain-containing protein [Sodalinema gerasimenkoae]|uniref:EndoU domain-containing protein n=1 Tax=Sodalinema gerasimenkoae TaxID=2862348 RepID=UPI00135809E2|nr:EndoU domain-containing protein [Sodalinema gerasimenkoae]
MTSKPHKPKSSKLGSLFGLGIATVAVLWSIGYDPGNASNCLNSSDWVTAYNNQQVNHAHIFCGELNQRGRLVGFHSRPDGRNPSTVARFNITQSPNSQGIYAGEWTYQGRSQETKFSTMFPDSCTPTQVINSIGHAATNTVSCPANAPHWAWCGPNSPGNAGDDRFCQADDGSQYVIAGANRSDGRINTGFPLRLSR